MGSRLAKRRLDGATTEMLRRLEEGPRRCESEEIALFAWHGHTHLGRIARPYPEKPYIVFVSKFLEPVTPEAAAVLRRDRRLPSVMVHPKVDFTARNHLLGITGETLCLLSGEDFIYCLVHPHPYAGEGYHIGYDLPSFSGA
ncbi:MAG: hypothetical protein IT208_03670 [Chthonomonadales bacterium]|nr:hypothetical protein [Chthonomonadales bacterium]